jgi:hypothetical protein
MPPKKKKRKNEGSSEVKEPPAKRARKNKRDDDDNNNKEEEDWELVDLTEEAELLQAEKALVPKKDLRDTELVASLDKDLVCCICLHLMDNPHSFPCGHSFCQGMWTSFSFSVSLFVFTV